jgi:hypothetical protein
MASNELSNNINPIIQEHRIDICIACVENTQEPVPHCQQCNKPISLLTSEETETCPLDKW